MQQSSHQPASMHRSESITAATERASRVIILGYSCATLIWVVASSGTIEALGLPTWIYTLRAGLYAVVTVALLWVLTKRLVSRLELSENSFADAETGFRTLFDIHPTPLWLYDPQSLRLVKGNLAALHTYGYASDDIKGMSLSKLYAGEVSQPLSQAPSGSIIGLLEGAHRLRRRDGVELSVTVLVRPCSFQGRSLGLLVVEEEHSTQDRDDRSAYRQRQLELAQHVGMFGCWEYLLDDSDDRVAPGCVNEDWPKAEPLSREQYRARIAEEDRDKVERAHLDVMRSGRVAHEYRIIQPDGAVRYLFERIQLRPGPTPGMHLLCGAFSDVTEIRAVGHKLARQRALYERMLNSFPEGVVVIRGDRVHYANDAARRLFLSERLDNNRMFSQFIHPEHRAREVDRIVALQRGLISESPLRQVRLLRADGSELEAEVIEIRLDDSELPDVLLLIRDISHTLRMRRNLEDANGRLQALSQRLMDIRETERRQLARELHDDIGQQLTGLKLHLQRMSGQLNDNLEMQAVTIELTNTLDGLLATVRRLSLALHPLQLETLGLEAAIRTHLDRFLDGTRTRWAFTIEGDLANVPIQKALVAFRIIQEAVTNVIRHAQATSLHIRLNRQADGLHMEIVDDGTGFDVAAARKRAQSLGLTSMQERVASLGGELKITSLEGVGTRITVRLPRTFERSGTDGESL